MTTLVPHLWFDTQAVEAAQLYTRLIPNSRLKARVVLPDTPSGDAELVICDLAGQEFQLLNAGPLFRFTPAISFLIAVEGPAEVDRLVAGLGEGGGVLMPLGTYPFAERYAWVSDRWGVNWQVMYRPGHRPTQVITPTLMFVGAQLGRAEEAFETYVKLFNGSLNGVMRYPEGAAPDRPGTVQHLEATLAGTTLAAMDSAHDHRFGFNEAVSLLVLCDTQAEIDHLWATLSHDPAAEACGWCRDAFGVSWQIAPRALGQYLEKASDAQKRRFLPTMLKQKKFDVKTLGL